MAESGLSEVAGRLAEVRRRIAAACERSGRDPAGVRLLLATKTVPPERIAEAVLAGASLLGENKVQEGIAKHRQVGSLTARMVEWHFIGHLQTNKVADVLKWSSLVQSVDRPELVDKLQRRLEHEDRTLDVYMQVNTSAEASKFGVHPDAAPDLARRILAADRLALRGLMTIGLLGATPEAARPSLRALRLTRDRLLHEGIVRDEHVQELSMGMTGDLEVAIEECATLVRVGTAVFGPRPTPDTLYWPV